MTRWVQLLLAGAAIVAVACGGEVASPVDGGASPSRGTSGGTDTSGTPGQASGQTSNGPVASLTLTPHAVSLPLGHYASLVATARDAVGVRVIKPVTWRSSDPSVTIASDTGVVYAKALGTARIYATVDGFTDSTIVTVVPAPPAPPPSTPAAVAEFNMTVVAFGTIPGTDTSRVERISGATISLMRRGGMSGDSLSTPVDAGSAITKTNGEAKFSRLPGGTYSIRVTPPLGSSYAETMSGIAPPRQSDITVYVTLRK